jgi:hypothetical protein
MARYEARSSAGVHRDTEDPPGGALRNGGSLTTKAQLSQTDISTTGPVAIDAANHVDTQRHADCDLSMTRSLGSSRVSPRALPTFATHTDQSFWYCSEETSSALCPEMLRQCPIKPQRCLCHEFSGAKGRTAGHLAC